ncbi:recombinase family protein [Comamonas odontotermitis]|uniref:recombinase family protein n=1 Tax=Comamonas odontotermitis TaxID=379895 RepID=UPI00366FD97B
MSIVRAYLRASTKEQDAMRAKADLTRFAQDQNFEIATWYIENQSGANLNRPELNRLINEALPTDVLLIEQVDRLTRLSPAEWDELKLLLATKKIRVVSLDLPTSWLNIKSANDPITEALLEAINKMMLDVLAAVACKDYQVGPAKSNP